MTTQLIQPYGAAELKTGYNRNLATGLVLSVVFHLILIGVYVLTVSSGITRVMPSLPPPRPTTIDYTREQGGGGGKVMEEQGPVDVPSLPGTDIADDMRPVDDEKMEKPLDPKVMHPNIMGPVNGDDTVQNNRRDSGPSIPSDTGSEDVRVRVPRDDDRDDSNLPDTEFVPVEEEAQCDLNELRSRIVYPEVARRNGIEGDVIVRALVGRDGRVLKVIIDYSDNKVLETSARDAVIKTRFKPAIQNKIPVAMWVQVPVSFRLPKQ